MRERLGNHAQPRRGDGVHTEYRETKTISVGVDGRDGQRC